MPSKQTIWVRVSLLIIVIKSIYYNIIKLKKNRYLELKKIFNYLQKHGKKKTLIKVFNKQLYKQLSNSKNELSNIDLKLLEYQNVNAPIFNIKVKQNRFSKKLDIQYLNMSMSKKLVFKWIKECYKVGLYKNFANFIYNDMIKLKKKQSLVLKKKQVLYTNFLVQKRFLRFTKRRKIFYKKSYLHLNRVNRLFFQNILNKKQIKKKKFKISKQMYYIWKIKKTDSFINNNNTNINSFYSIFNYIKTLNF